MKNIRARRAFMVAAVAAIAVPAVLVAEFVILSDRYRACYVGPQVNGCYVVYGQLVAGKGFLFRNKLFGFGFRNSQLTVAVRSDSAMAAYIARTGDAGKDSL